MPTFWPSFVPLPISSTWQAWLFTSVEQADTRLRGKPVAVGRESRGIIASASYEARKFGVYRPLPTGQARKLCPKLIVFAGSLRSLPEILQLDVRLHLRLHAGCGADLKTSETSRRRLATGSSVVRSRLFNLMTRTWHLFLSVGLVKVLLSFFEVFCSLGQGFKVFCL